MINTQTIPSWAFKMLEKIKQSEFAEIVLVVEKEREMFPKTSLLTKIKNNYGKLFYIVYTKIDNKLFRVQPNAFENININTLLSDTPIMTVNPIKQGYSEYFQEESINTLKQYQLDVIIRLGFGILRGEILKCAKYGIWSYHHGDNKVNRGTPPGFWEVLEGWDETGSILQILTDELDGGAVLYRSYSNTNQISVKLNINNLYWKTSSFIPRKLKELYVLGEDKFLEKIKRENIVPQFYSDRLYTVPTNIQMFQLLLKHVFKYFLKKIRGVFYIEQWILLYGLKNSAGISTSMWKYKKIIPPKDRFWADPFVIYKNNRYYIFLEELIYKARKGHISYMIMDEKGNYSKPEKVLDKDYHLSYPYLLEYEGEFFMVPETSQNRTIELYKCTEFPRKWEFVKYIMTDVTAVDTTLFYRDGKWWMFCNIKENDGGSTLEELFLFYSDSLLSDKWSPHPKNPIVSDVKSARPAGKIFNYKGNWYRPSQNCAKKYGYGIKINKITKLNESEYEEVEVSRINPTWNTDFVSTHTINNDNCLTIIDGLMKRSKLFY